MSTFPPKSASSMVIGFSPGIAASSAAGPLSAGASAPPSATASLGQRTDLAVGTDGRIAAVARTNQGATEEVSFDYEDDGLLASVEAPMGGLYEYQWDELGRLARVDDPENGSLVLAAARVDEATRTIDATTAMGRTGSSKIAFGSDRSRSFESTDSAGVSGSSWRRTASRTCNTPSRSSAPAWPRPSPPWAGR